MTQDPPALSAMGYLATIPIPFLTAGLYLLWRKPESRSTWLLVGGTAGTMAFSALLERLVHRQYLADGAATWMSWALLVEALVMSVGLGCLALLIGLFPNGVPKTGGERRFATAMWVLPVPMLVALLSNEDVLIETIAYGGVGPFRNPLYIEALGFLGPATTGMRSIIAGSLLVAVGLLLVRYRRESAPERRQIRWVLFGSAFAIAIGIIPFVIGPLLDPGVLDKDGLVMVAGSFALLLIPITVVIGIEQPTWLDTDEVIRKSFAYGALSIGVFVAYATIAAALGLAAGARFPVEVAIAVTALMAFAFQPAHRRLQLVADRWVFGEQPTAIAAVADFDRSIHQPDAGDELEERLAGTIRRAARVRWVTVELPPAPAFTAGSPTGAEIHSAAIRHGDEEFGVVRCGPKVAGQFKEADGDLVEALAGQAALVISNARLAARIVQAQEAERRRIERNIHDGAQQELVALVAKLGLARARARNEALDETTLIELQHDAGAILKELRELAQGIHPSVLTDGGLVEAVEDRCSRLPIDVVVEASPGLRSIRFHDDVEGAAYFFVTEGLTNVLKHAAATKARVGLRRLNGHLELSVADNGHGFDPARIRRNGLAGLADRFAALSGSVSIESTPGRGTVIAGRIPEES
jgi:signal transduction histidine kinase